MNELVFDKESAKELCSDNSAFLKELLTGTVEELKAKKDALQVSVQRKDSARVAEIAHNIKGMALMCGFKRLARAASECEESASLSDYLSVRTRSQVVVENIAMAVKVAATYNPEDDI